MGICSSSATSIQDDTYGHENSVHYAETSPDARFGSTYSHGGSKGINQDYSILFQGYGIEDGIFGGVFDGHGKNGHTVGKFVRNRLPTLVLNQRTAFTKFSPSANTKQNEKLETDKLSPNKNFIKWKEACLSAFKLMDKEIKCLDSLDCSSSGTTAAVVVKQGDDLIIANLGDSRAVLGTRTENGIVPTQLTTDLKPGVPAEAERIRKCNGRVLALKEEAHIQRVWLPYDDSPGLAMSRSFGDFVLKNHGIISTPDVTHHHLSPEDQFLVIASDGIWDVLSNDQVMDIVSSSHNEEGAAKQVVDEAIATWKKKYPNSKRDDCTVICLFFQREQ